MTSRDPEVYRTLLENLSDGVMVIGFDGSVMIANSAICRMFQLDPAEVVGHLFGEIFVAFEDFDEFTQIILDAVSARSGTARRVTSVHIGDEFRSLSITTSYLTSPRSGSCARPSFARRRSSRRSSANSRPPIAMLRHATRLSP